MSTGKKTGASSSRATSERFPSELARASYLTNFIMRGLIGERGFNLQALRSRFPDMIRDIEERKWTQLCGTPEPAVVPLVKEFYSFASESYETHVRIRGTKVSFSPRAINAFFKIPNQVEHIMDQWANEEMENESELILQAIAIPGAVWGAQRRVNTRVFPQSFLQPLWKMWYYFICARLLPTTHTSEVTRERALVLYCLATGRPINIGRLISTGIMECSKQNTGSLWYPSLITALCRKANVPIDTEEEIERPRAPIQNIIEPRIPQAPRPVEPPRPSLASRVDALESSLNHMSHQQTQFMDYSMNTFDALGDRLRWLALHRPGDDMTDFPVMPAHPHFSPDVVDDSDSENF